MKNNNKNKIYNPKYWGISHKSIQQVKKTFANLRHRFKKCFKTTKKNLFKYAYMYISKD